MSLIEKAKLALRIKTDAFDDQITDLIEAAKAEMRSLGISDAVTGTPEDYPFAQLAILTFVRLNFGEPENPELLQKRYDDMILQMQLNAEYSDTISRARCRRGQINRC